MNNGDNKIPTGGFLILISCSAFFTLPPEKVQPKIYGIVGLWVPNHEKKRFQHHDTEKTGAKCLVFSYICVQITIFFTERLIRNVDLRSLFHFHK